MINLRKNKTSIICHSILALVIIALLIIGSKWDLQISKTISNGDSFYGLMFAILGEFPAYLIIPVSGAIIFNNVINHKFKSIHTKRFLFLASIIFIAAGWFIFSKISFLADEIKALDKFKNHMLGLSILASISMTIVTVTLASSLNPDNCRRLLRWAIFAIAILITTLITAQVLKYFWGRLRFRDMVAMNDYSGFTAWYKPQGHIKNCRSFPSGHTTSAVNLFILVPFVTTFTKKKWTKIATYIGCTAFVLMVASSRIIYRAHFLTDVTVGGTLSYIWFVILNYFFFTRRHNKQVKKMATPLQDDKDKIQVTFDK